MTYKILQIVESVFFIRTCRTLETTYIVHYLCTYIQLQCFKCSGRRIGYRNKNGQSGTRDSCLETDLQTPALLNNVNGVFTRKTNFVSDDTNFVVRQKWKSSNFCRTRQNLSDDRILYKIGVSCKWTLSNTLAAWRRRHCIRLRNKRPGFESRQGERFLRENIPTLLCA
jgi:hypothetical protein